MRRSKVLTIAKRQLSSLRNEKTILFAILIQLMVAAFSSFLIVGFVAIFEPSGVDQNQKINIGLAGNGSEEILDTLDDTKSQVQVFDDRQTAEESFNQGESNVLIFSEMRENGQINATIVAPEEGFTSTLSVVRAQGLLERYDKLKRQIASDNTDVSILEYSRQTEDSNPFISFVYTVLIPMLIFLPSFISGAIVVDTVIQDRKTGMVDILRTPPVTDTELVIGKLLVPLMLGPLQVMAWILLLSVNGISVHNTLIIVGIAAAITSVAVTVGVFITRYFDNRGSAQFGYSSVLVLLIGLSTLLPELPTTTIGRLALGSQDHLTFIIASGYILTGILLIPISVRIYRYKK